MSSVNPIERRRNLVDEIESIDAVDTVDFTRDGYRTILASIEAGSEGVDALERIEDRAEDLGYEVSIATAPGALTAIRLDLMTGA